MSELRHDLQKLLLFMSILLGCLLTTPALAAFSIAKAKMIEGSITAGQTAGASVEISSNAEMSDVTVQLTLTDATRRVVARQEFARQKFVAGKPVPFTAHFPTKGFNDGAYALAVGLYGNNMMKTFFFEDDLAPLKVSSVKETKKPSISIVEKKMKPSAGTFGENAEVVVSLKSETEVSGVNVEIRVHDSSKRVAAKQEFKAQAFTANQTLNFTATFPTVYYKPGKYSVSVHVTSEDQKTSYVSKDKLAQFNITHPAPVKTTGIGGD
ncbi:MAG TPA: hypothetical protein VM432_02285 [Bdellovibrionales bacterium]|jgi:hypothetical protein|nr:hypothetical protein [Bdellovibrionales bacterium]